jgi:hypothetical protein
MSKSPIAAPFQEETIGLHLKSALDTKACYRHGEELGPRLIQMPGEPVTRA